MEGDSWKSLCKGINLESTLEENTGRALFDMNCSSIFLDLLHKTKEIKAKINKWNPTKKLLHSKGNHRKTKRQSTEWEKIFANDVTKKELISNMYKQLIQLNIKKPQIIQ